MTINLGLYNELINIIQKNNISIGEYLKNHTYSKMGGKADFFITPTSYEEVQNIVKYCKREIIPITIIGNGSKVIVKDGGVRGVVLSLKKLNKINISENKIIAQSGANLISVSRKALESHLSGLEFACGIPGTIGGAVFMNAGAFEGEIKDVLESILVVDNYGNIVKREKKDLEFGYRKSNIGDRGDIIIEATFNLNKGKYRDIKAVMDEFTIRRNQKQPIEYPSCGSVFKRPVGYYAGKLIEESNLQGVRIGGAEVSKKHAGFIVNVNNATAAEYINLIEYVQKTVKEKFNVNLEREVKIIGEDTEE